MKHINILSTKNLNKQFTKCNFTKKGAISGFAILLFTVVAQTNVKADNKFYPGASCVEINDTTSEIIYDSFARARNTASGSNTVVCPAVKDASAIDDAHVSVLDNHPNGRVSCIVQTRDRTGSIGEWTITRQSSLNGTGNYIFNWFNGLDDLNYNPSDGYHFVRCSIPGTFGGARSGVNSYGINE